MGEISITFEFKNNSRGEFETRRRVAAQYSSDWGTVPSIEYILNSLIVKKQQQNEKKTKIISRKEKPCDRELIYAVIFTDSMLKFAARRSALWAHFDFCIL